MTRDVDATFVPHEIVHDEAMRVADVFAMKALAARERDVDDLQVLAGIVGIETEDQAMAIVSEFYPDEPMPPRAAAVINELFNAP